MDSYTFNQRRMRIEPVASVSPQELTDELGNKAQIQLDAECYFASTHNFLPIGLSTSQMLIF